MYLTYKINYFLYKGTNVILYIKCLIKKKLKKLLDRSLLHCPTCFVIQSIYNICITHISLLLNLIWVLVVLVRGEKRKCLLRFGLSCKSPQEMGRD